MSEHLVLPRYREHVEAMKEESKDDSKVDLNDVKAVLESEDFDKYLKATAGSFKILNLGCGNSPLAEEMHDRDGYTQIESIDNSSVCIR